MPPSSNSPVRLIYAKKFRDFYYILYPHSHPRASQIQGAEEEKYIDVWYIEDQLLPAASHECII